MIRRGLMQLTDYFVTAGVSIFFLVGCLVHLHENDIFSTRAIGRSKLLIYVLIFQIAIDVVFTSLNGQNVSQLLLYSVKGLELLINPIIAFLVFNVFYDKKIHRHDRTMNALRRFMVLAIVVNAALLTVSCFTGFVFYVDEYNVYHRGSWIFVYLAILVFAIIVLVYGIGYFSSKTQSIMKNTLFSFTAVLTLGLILRGFFPDSNYDFLCISVGCLLLLIYYSHVTLRLDSLTQLLNRHVYSRMLERIDYTTAIVMIDANNFKSINDTYGHECGDQTLKQIARNIREVYGKYAWCFRLGGDEFCAILKPGVFDDLIEKTPHYDAYSMMEGLMRKLDELIMAQAEENGNSDCYVAYGVSQGYGIFYPMEESPIVEDWMPLGQIIELADRRMYHNKSLFKEKAQESIDVQGPARAKVVYRPSVCELIKGNGRD